jgi:hypothetical protein
MITIVAAAGARKVENRIAGKSATPNRTDSKLNLNKQWPD